MHVLLANNIYPPIMAGGAELIVSYLAEGLAARGHRVTVVSTCGPEMEPYPVEMRNGVEILRFFPKNFYWHWTRGDRPGWQKALWHLRDAWNADAGKRFGEIVRTHKPDILHTHLIDGLSAAIWQRARQAGVPVIHTAHDYHLLCPRSVMLTKRQKLCTDPTLPCQAFRKWHLRTTRHVNLFCSPSQFLIDQHQQAGLAAPTAVVRNGIPLPALQPKIRSQGAPLRFLFPARHTIEKGCQVLLDAIKRIPREVPIEFLIAGKGPMEADFAQAAALDPRIVMLGYIQGESKEAAFRKADCVLVPSLWYENAPVVIVEAAAYGLGVIGSDIGAIPEFVKHGQTGLLFEPGNAEALAAAMQELAANPQWLERFAANAASLVAASSVDSMADNYVAHYEALTSPPFQKS